MEKHDIWMPARGCLFVLYVCVWSRRTYCLCNWRDRQRKNHTQMFHTLVSWPFPPEQRMYSMRPLAPPLDQPYPITKKERNMYVCMRECVHGRQNRQTSNVERKEGEDLYRVSKTRHDGIAWLYIWISNLYLYLSWYMSMYVSVCGSCSISLSLPLFVSLYLFYLCISLSLPCVCVCVFPWTHTYSHTRTHTHTRERERVRERER